MNGARADYTSRPDPPMRSNYPGKLQPGARRSLMGETSPSARAGLTAWRGGLSTFQNVNPALMFFSYSFAIIRTVEPISDKIREEIKAMFTPDKTFRRIASVGFRRNCAYIYKDGIMAVERKEARTGKYTAEIEVHHFWHCEIDIRTEEYSAKGDYWISKSDPMQCQRIVMHEPRELLSGIESVRVVYNNGSEATRERNIPVTSVIFTAPNGMTWDHHIIPWLSSTVTPQPNNYDHYSNGQYSSIDELIEDCKAKFENYEVHS